MTRSDGFLVDPDALSSAHAGVGRLLNDMSEFSTLAPSYPESVFGHAELAESTGEFHDRWQDGMGELSEECESIHRRLGETINEYRRVDENIATAFHRLRDDQEG